MTKEEIEKAKKAVYKLCDLLATNGVFTTEYEDEKKSILDIIYQLEQELPKINTNY